MLLWKSLVTAAFNTVIESMAFLVVLMRLILNTSISPHSKERNNFARL